MTDSTLLYIILGIVATIGILILIPLSVTVSRYLFKKSKFTTLGKSSKVRFLHQLDDAVQQLAAEKTGAIITIVRKQKLDAFRTDGIILDANISASLIVALFQKDSPLHDGAIIIDNDKITYSGTYYKISNKSINNKFGSRHRAALGISEQTDAVTIVVSEETGKVTMTKSGTMTNVPIKNIQPTLVEALND